MKPRGCSNNCVATTTTATPQKTTHASSLGTFTCFHAGTSPTASGARLRTRSKACTASSARSTTAAPQIIARPMRKPILRNGSSAPSQPMLRR